ncbi:DoxX family protein [Mesorhizobium kowhaii]|uniref:DoxX subfamily n=1 Tax=Mesorhizobium kowhaii TaxID=1300272 RepID=A0A2W7CQH9_9HYPH|nr:DoxX family protein [Mesorhizobium kowhaii]PZV38863.1 DoxX subfamily [Mesorhizobium kowhaii]
MSPKTKQYGLTAIKVVLTLAFAAAGIAKLAGVDMMVQIFGAIGLGQWFRYLTGSIEIIGVVLLWVNGTQFIGAGLLLCTMIGALVAHTFVLGLGSAPPAVVLGVLAAVLVFTYRKQNPVAGF